MLLHVSRCNGADINELKKLVFNIPEDIFTLYDESKISLVNEIAVYVDINFAERVLVDWFVQNPDRVAKSLTQIHANSLVHCSKARRNNYIPLHCCDGITYSDGFETFTRILTKDVEASHSCLLDIESPLGRILENLKVGETSGEYKILERLSPYVATFRLAANLRSNGNDGTDVFKQFTVPEKQEELIPYMEDILRRYSPQGKRNDDVLQNPNFPLVMKGKYTDPQDPIRAAVSHLTSECSAQYLKLFSKGNDTPKKIIIDIYTAVYFGIMNFTSTLVNLGIEIVICQYTKKVIEDWLENILRDDYMSMGISEIGIYKVTSEDIQRDALNLIQGLQTLLANARVDALQPTDTPEILIKLRDLFDDTVYSTFQLSIANNIPLLSIDHLMCEVLHGSEYPIANMNSIVMKILNEMTLKDRKESIKYQLLVGTPVPVFYNDIAFLSRSIDLLDTCLVYKFMEKYGDTIDTIDSPLSFLTEILRNATAVAYIDGSILRGSRTHNPEYEGYVEHIFNYCARSAMMVLDGETAEQRFALLLHNVIDTPSRIPKYVKLISYLASQFATGHFLDVEACNKALVTYQEYRLSEGHVA